MDGSRLVSAPPPRPVSKSPPNLRPFIYIALIIFLVFSVWKYNSQLSIINSKFRSLVTGASPTPYPEWATYSNQDFSFQYPGAWGQPQKTITGCGLLESITDPEKEYEISVAVRCNRNNTTGKPYSSLEDYLKESPLKISLTTVDSVKAAKTMSYLATSKSATEIIFMTSEKTIYSISLGYFAISDHPSPIPSPVLKYFDNILSTLKFSR